MLTYKKRVFERK